MVCDEEHLRGSYEQIRRWSLKVERWYLTLALCLCPDPRPVCKLIFFL